MQLETATQQTLPHRVDSDFVWQDPPASPRNFGDIRYRLEAQTIGDRFGGFRAFFYVPEASLRAFEKTTLAGALLRLAPAAVYGGLLVVVLWFLFRFVREREARWRPILAWALAGGLALVIATADRWPALIAQYRTDMPWRLWQVFLAVELVFAFLGGLLATAVLFAPLQLTAPKTAALANPAARRLWARDAFWAGLLALLWMAGWHRWDAVLNAWGHRFGVITLASAGGLDTLVPGLADLVMAPFQALWGAALLGIVVPALAMAWRDRRWRPWLAPMLLFLCLGTLPSVHTAAQFGFELALTAAEWALVGIFIWIFLRDNPLAYLSAGLLAALLPPALAYCGQGALRYHAAGAVLLAAAAAWLIWLAAQTRIPADRSAPASARSSAP